MQHDFAQSDPVLEKCGVPGTVWQWWKSSVDGSQPAFEAARQHGIYQGISCSILAKIRAAGILSLSAGNPSKIIVLTAEIVLKLQYISELALAVLIGMKDISMSFARLELSEREVEILKWTVEGKIGGNITDPFNF